MRIVIAGAGAVGTHLAKLLSKEKHDIILMDPVKEQLYKAQFITEIMTYNGSSTVLNDLEEVEVDDCDLFIAVTPDEAVNITSCILARNLGAKRTFARIDNYEYLLPRNKEFFEKVGVDSMVYPEMLAAKEIVNAIKHPWVRFWLELSNGSLYLIGVKIRSNSILADQPLYKLSGEEKKFHIVAIKRGLDTLIPKGNDKVMAEDVIFFTTTRQYLNEIPEIMGKKVIDVKNVMIMGGSRIAIRTCQYLPDNINIKLLESDKEKCEYLVEKLPSNVTVYHNDGRNADFLTQERISDMDAFVAVTGSSEANIMSCIVAKKFGSTKTVAEIENMDYISTAENLNIGSIINKKLITVNAIYRFLLNEDVSNVKTLMVANADVAEIVIKPNANVTKYEVKRLHMPQNVTLGGLIRNGEAIMIEGDTLIEPYDHVIVFCMYDSLKEAEMFFSY